VRTVTVPAGVGAVTRADGDALGERRTEEDGAPTAPGCSEDGSSLPLEGGAAGATELAALTTMPGCPAPAIPAVEGDTSGDALIADFGDERDGLSTHTPIPVPIPASAAPPSSNGTSKVLFFFGGALARAAARTEGCGVG
jgi:hypothetical protein